jgi:hypothetical protein
MHPYQDPSGFGRLSQTTGVGRWVAVIGLLAMLGGVAVFGFGILLMMAAVRAEETPKGFPPWMLAGFGVGMVGAFAYSIGLALGTQKKQKRPKGDTIIGDGVVVQKFKSGGDIKVGPVTTRVDKRMRWVNDLASRVEALDLDPEVQMDAIAAVRNVESSVQDDRPDSEIAFHLRALTRVLREGGAALVAGGGVANAILGLAHTLGEAGAGVAKLLGS